MAYYTVVLYSGASIGFMIFKSYAELVLHPGGILHQDGQDDEGKKLLLMVVGAAQIALIFFLGAVGL